ncbi:MAG: thiazole synthase [Rickettsiales bacterium]|nr:thiazole synthase [Rickettsiales bacterium]
MDAFMLAGKAYSSRLLVGTGRYKDMAQTKEVVQASGADIVTVSVRRTPLAGAGELLQDVLPPSQYTYLPNSAGCYTAEEAVRTLRLARELGGWELVKLEVIGDKDNLYPDVEETLKAARVLVAEGFQVMAYTTDDPIIARKLEDVGCAAVMPLAAPIGTGLGILNPAAIARIVQQAGIPVLVDAGIGTASDACLAMELGCAGVLLNTALSAAGDPVAMAVAMKHAVLAGRAAFLAGRMPKRDKAVPSSPLEGNIASIAAYIGNVVAIASRQGYVLEEGQNGRQINFGNKKLHEGHLRELYPGILKPGANIAKLIEAVAPGRPCTHEPMRKIIQELLE